jgi:hypothetical protein
VRCIVVRDLVTKAGDLAEATDDWYAQAKDKNIWYCGEEIKLQVDLLPQGRAVRVKKCYGYPFSVSCYTREASWVVHRRTT